MKTIIHVNQHRIRENAKTGSVNPALTIKDYHANRYAHRARIVDDSGHTVAEIVYSPDKPLSCGARVWIETRLKVETEKFAP